MKMKINILKTGPMIMTGSKILKAIMDNSTPPIDLFVRESIQNSADQIMSDKPFGKIHYKIDSFNNNKLLSLLELTHDIVRNNYPNENYDFIAISDSNTYGLLGEPNKSINGEPNNLYNLVYDFMSNNEGKNAGGSWGIGKSVYYKYGNGLCFYYSRTFEKGHYISKLAGALIQDEKKPNCFLGKNSSGIAYFGNVDEKNNSIPIYNDEQIIEFLNVFNLEPYTEDKTGTIVIIPYLDTERLLDINNANDGTSRYWLNSIQECLSMAIQRWYFARINNESFNGKYLSIAVNGVKIELCKFFQIMQDLYNGKSELGCKTAKVIGKKFESNEILGTFNYKLFSKEELGVHTPLTNLPSPRYFVDSDIDVDRDGLLFYLRKPGMVLNYENRLFGSYDVPENYYLIGVFILNDGLVINSQEELGQYIRQTEKSNHYDWKNDKIKDFPILSSRQPLKKICSFIRDLLNAEFKKENVVNIEESATYFQKKMGQLLMPPLDFGNSPTLPSNNSRSNKRNLVKIKKANVEFKGVTPNGNLIYEVSALIPVNSKLFFEIDLKAGSKTFTFNEWESMEFDFPCLVKQFTIEEFKFDKNEYNTPTKFVVENLVNKVASQLYAGETIFRLKGYWTRKNILYGFGIENVINENVELRMTIEIEVVDNKYSIGFTTKVEKGTL